VKTKKNGMKVISLAVNPIEYENSRYDDFIKPFSKEANQALTQALAQPSANSKDGQFRLI
jgi:hypothetical protein